MNERRKIIFDGYANNIPLKQIAAELNCSVASVKVTAHKMGVTRTPKVAAEFRRGWVIPEELLADYKLFQKKGLCAEYAARALGIIA